MKPLFETNRATDIGYVLQYARDKVNFRNACKPDPRAHTQLNTFRDETKGDVFGVADLMYALGDYPTRKDASKAWTYRKSLKSEKQTNNLHESFGQGSPNDGSFAIQREIKQQIMDFCTINDFYENVLPHLTGPIAHCIREARSRTATIATKRSDKLAALMVANEEALQNAPEDIRKIVEAACEEAERALDNSAQVPVSVMDCDDKWTQLDLDILRANTEMKKLEVRQSEIMLELRKAELSTEEKKHTITTYGTALKDAFENQANSGAIHSIVAIIRKIADPSVEQAERDGKEKDHEYLRLALLEENMSWRRRRADIMRRDKEFEALRREEEELARALYRDDAVKMY